MTEIKRRRKKDEKKLVCKQKMAIECRTNKKRKAMNIYAAK